MLQELKPTDRTNNHRKSLSRLQLTIKSSLISYFDFNERNHIEKANRIMLSDYFDRFTYPPTMVKQAKQLVEFSALRKQAAIREIANRENMPQN